MSGKCSRIKVQNAVKSVNDAMSDAYPVFERDLAWGSSVPCGYGQESPKTTHTQYCL